jgi:glycogen synthase
MFMPDDCDVKQIFRNDFVDMINILVTGTEYYKFQLYGNERSQGPNWYNQEIKYACFAREYLAFINALDKQLEREDICIVSGGTYDNDCVWVVCAA